MDLSQNKKKLPLEIQHQKNLKFVLSMEDEQFQEWVGTLPDDALDYLEWLIEETEYMVDDIVLDTVGLAEADKVISKFLKPKI